MCGRDVEDNLPLVLRQTGQQRLRDPLVERRVATGQQLGAGVVHAGTGEGHVIAAGCIKGSETHTMTLFLVKGLAMGSALRGHTRGAEAESAGRAQTAASDAGRRRRLLVSRSGLVLAGRHQQADVGVQLDQQTALEHPHHHLDQLGLVRRDGPAEVNTATPQNKVT